MQAAGLCQLVHAPETSAIMLIGLLFWPLVGEQFGTSRSSTFFPRLACVRCMCKTVGTSYVKGSSDHCSRASRLQPCTIGGHGHRQRVTGLLTSNNLARYQGVGRKAPLRHLPRPWCAFSISRNRTLTSFRTAAEDSRQLVVTSGKCRAVVLAATASTCTCLVHASSQNEPIPLNETPSA